MIEIGARGGLTAVLVIRMQLKGTEAIKKPKADRELLKKAIEPSQMKAMGSCMF